MKCRHCSKVCETTRGMTKHLSIYKVQQDTICRTVPCNTLYKTNDFPRAKAEAILLLIKPISKKKSLYIDTLDGKDPAGINEVAEMLGRSEDIEMQNVKHIRSKSKYITFSQSRLGIQSI